MESRFRTWEEAVQWLRSQPDQHHLVHAAYYDDPLIAAATRYWQSDEWRAIRSLLPPAEGRALDVGAGRGIASFALAKEGFQVSALEPDASALVGSGAIQNLARQTSLPITIAHDSAMQLPFPDAHFRLVFARAVLHHIDDLRRACREFFRVLEPGGHLVAVREHVISRQEDLDAFLDHHPLHKVYGGENALLIDGYIEPLTRAGFRVDRILTPLRSPINLAPHTKQSVQTEIVNKAFGRLPLLARIAATALRTPSVWGAILPLLELVDHRPGRLYSFVAVKS